MNQLKIGVILTYLQTIINAVISLAYTPIMLRLLGQNEYGIYTMSSSMIAYLGLLNFGLNSSYVRFYTRYKENGNTDGVNQLNGIFITVYTGIAMVALVIGLMLSKNIELIYGNTLSVNELKTARILMAILSFNLSLTFVSTVFTSFVTANEKFIFQKLLNMGKTVVSPLVTIPVLLLGFRSIGMVVVTTTISIIVDIINIVFCVSKLHMKFAIKGADFRLIGEIASYSIFIAINSIVDQINWQIDKVILGHYHGSKETAVYGVASQLNTLYISVSTAISSVFIPRVHKLFYASDRQKQYNRLFIKIGRVQMLALGLVGTGLILFGKQFIFYWAGDGYENAYYITLLLTLPGTIAFIQNIGIEIQRARNMHQFRSYMYLVMAVINVIISIPLGKVYGGLGCATGTAISLILANGIAMNWFYAKKMEMQIDLFWKKILLLFPSIVLSFLMGFIIIKALNVDSFVKLCSAIILYSLIYFIVSWLFGMNQEEKNLFKSIVSKIVKL